MLIKVDQKEKVVRKAIDMWLKDPSIYCNWCGKQYEGDDVKYIPSNSCCESPQIGRNIDHCMAIIKQNRELRETRRNSFASTQDKSIRFAVSLPPTLLGFLDKFFRQFSDDKKGIFKEEGELTWFAKRFPQFTIPERV
jgi:hypothetical protein